MNRRIVVALSLLSFVAGVSASANESSVLEKKGHRKHRTEKKKNGEVQKLAYGNVTIGKVQNDGHHEVLFLFPDGTRKIIHSGDSCSVTALFTVTKRKPLGEITKDELEKECYLMKKGDHLFTLMLTPDGFGVCRLRDKKHEKKGLLTKAGILLPSGTEDVSRDLLIQHVTGKSKTSAFSVHETGSLQPKEAQPKRASSGSLLGKK